MTKRRSRVLTLGVITAGTAAAMYAYGQNLTSLGLAPGEWEFTQVITPAIPIANAANLPPAVQQAIARLKQPHTFDRCVTAKDMAEFDVSNPDQDVGKCTVTSQTITGTTVDVERSCSRGDKPTTQKIHLNVLSSKNVEAMVNVLSALGPTSVSITAKWLADACKGALPVAPGSTPLQRSEKR